MADCDAIIVNYNSGSLLSNCVASVLAARGRAIVVDNASSDDSIDMLTMKFGGMAGLMVIRNIRNLGFAAACNIGAGVATAGHLLFLNPDSVLDRQSLAKMQFVLDSASDIGMVGAFLSDPDGSEQPGGRRVFPTPRRAFIRAFGLSRLGEWFPSLFSDFLLHKEPLPAEPAAVEAISGACMLVKREAMEDVGPWDEGYFLHCEDLDWCMRFRRKDWDILFVPDARIIHHQGACSRSRPLFVEWHKHKGMMRFYRKFFRDRYPKPLWALVAFGVWLRFLMIACYYGMRHVLTTVGVARG